MIERSEYRYARRQGGAFRSGLGRLIRLRGKDALDLLHRISTNDLLPLKPGGSRETLFTTDKGRIVDAAALLRRDDDLLLVPTPGREETLRAWIDRYIIMDDAASELSADPYAHWHVRGAHAPERLLSLMGLSSPLPPDTWRTPDALGKKAVLFMQQSFAPGLHLLLPVPDGQDALPGLLQEAGVAEWSGEMYDLLRIEEGLPRSGAEISDGANPLESGVRGAVSFTKGCYIGQEVVARLDTYDKVQRRLCGLQFEGNPATLPAPGAEIFSDGETAGILTSRASHPIAVTAVGLGLIRNAFALGVHPLTVREAGEEYPIRVVPLPMKWETNDEA